MKTVQKEREYSSPEIKRLILVPRRNLLQGSPTQDQYNPGTEVDGFNPSGM